MYSLVTSIYTQGITMRNGSRHYLWHGIILVTIPNFPFESFLVLGLAATSCEKYLVSACVFRVLPPSQIVIPISWFSVVIRFRLLVLVICGFFHSRFVCHFFFSFCSHKNKNKNKNKVTTWIFYSKVMFSFFSSSALRGHHVKLLTCSLCFTCEFFFPSSFVCCLQYC